MAKSKRLNSGPLMEAQKKLVPLVRELSYREGAFTLASGQKSSFYIDLKVTTLHPKAAHLIGKLAWEMVHSAGLAIGGVGGLTSVADPIATALSLAAWEHDQEWPAFMVRKEPKAHGTARWVEGVENLDAKKPLLILEDVTTSGGSALRAAEKVREAGFEATHVLTIVDRESGARELLHSEGLELLSMMTLDEIQGAQKLTSTKRT